MIAIVLSAIIAYLLGSINTSILVSRIFGNTDIRQHGSGNAGATNTLRVLGKKAAVMVVIGDGLKGVLAILFARYLTHILSGSEISEYAAAVCVALGHIFPVFFGFKGGKGIMTSIAVIFTLSPAIGGILVAVFAVVVLCFNYISLASCVASLCFPPLVYLFERGNSAFLVCAIIISFLAIIKHRTNIVRLFKGTESKFIKKNK
ncbi:MAG: glycerol-3-phosphate 1-O-acyltransferase PlsY [Ruminococcaceae bacterium]|nr:glycerol-3-phosphate 1-O-acyltransferase PlsY [Oscillospiraceae bacterium]